MKYFLIYIIFLSSFALASQEKELLLDQQYRENKSFNSVNSEPDLYQYSEGILASRDSKTGIINDPYYTLEDSVLVNFSYTLALDQKSITKIQSFDANIFYRPSNNYTNIWYGAQLKRVRALYNAVADELDSSGVTRGENAQIMNMAGVGVAYRFKIVSELLANNRFFERSEFYINYISHQDLEEGDKFQGEGFNVNYQLEYRANKTFSYALKLGYTQAWLARAAENDDEKLEQRSLIFGFADIGISVGLYF